MEIVVLVKEDMETGEETCEVSYVPSTEEELRELFSQFDAE